MTNVAGKGSTGLADDVAGARDALGAQVGAAASKARDLKKDVLGVTSDVSELTGLAGDLAGNAVTQGRQLLHAARGHATGFADDRKNDAAQSIADIASSLRDSGKAFDDRPNIQSFVGSAADGLEQLAGSIRDRSFAQIYSEAETYARARPLTVAVVTAAAGFLLARFIKSSADGLSEAAANQASATKAAANRHMPVGSPRSTT